MREKVHRIEVATRAELADPAGLAVKSDVADLGLAVDDVRFIRVYLVRTAESPAHVRRIAEELLSDPVCDVVAVEQHVDVAGVAQPPSAGAVSQKQSQAGAPVLHKQKTQPRAAGPHQQQIIEVIRKPGVMDPTEASTLKGIADLGFKASEVHTARRYLLAGRLTRDELVLIAEKLLANPSIEQYYINESCPSERPHAAPYRFKLVTVPIRAMSDERPGMG